MEIRQRRYLITGTTQQELGQRLHNAIETNEKVKVRARLIGSFILDLSVDNGEVGFLSDKIESGNGGANEQELSLHPTSYYIEKSSQGPVTVIRGDVDEKEFVLTVSGDSLLTDLPTELVIDEKQ